MPWMQPPPLNETRLISGCEQSANAVPLLTDGLARDRRAVLVGESDAGSVEAEHAISDLVGRGQLADLVFRLDVEVVDDDRQVVIRREAFGLPDRADVPGTSPFPERCRCG